MAIPDTVEWRFSEPQPDWKSALPIPGVEVAGLERTADALRVTLSEGSRVSRRVLAGGVYVDLPDWRREEWAELVVRARTTGSVSYMRIGLNPPEGVLPPGAKQPSPFGVFAATFQATGGFTPVVRDGLVHTYRIHLDWKGDPLLAGQRTGPWRRLGLFFRASTTPGTIDIISVRVVPVGAESAQVRVTETTLEPPQLKSDFALFRTALEEAHPTLYRYKTKREMDAEFARAEAKLTRRMTILKFRNVLAPVLAAIKDGHTEFANYQGDEISTVIGSAKQFPLALTFESMRGFVLLHEGLDDRVKPGMEVLAINGESLAEILQRILPNLQQDGDIRTHQMYQLGISRGFFQRDVGNPYRTGFSEAYRLYFGNPVSFRTTLRDTHTRTTIVVDLVGATLAEEAVNTETNPVNRDVLTGLGTLRALHPRNAIRYLEGEDTAILTPSWDPNTPDFFKEAFAGLRGHGTKNLVVDMRGNTGGFDQYPTLLFSYLSSKEFRSSEPNYMKTYQPSFKQYTDIGEIDSVADTYFGSDAGIWKPDPKGGWLMTEKYPIVGWHKPSENHFDGTVYVLIDGGSFSATSDFCATADFYKRATFVGEETGGAAEGDASGGDIGPTLPASHLHVGIPTEASFNVVDKSNCRRGTLPKYEVTQTIDDLVKGRDTALEFTRELIRSRKGRLGGGRRHPRG
jgi:Peptidase family S41